MRLQGCKREGEALGGRSIDDGLGACGSAHGRFALLWLQEMESLLDSLRLVI